MQRSMSELQVGQAEPRPLLSVVSECKLICDYLCSPCLSPVDILMPLQRPEVQHLRRHRNHSGVFDIHDR